MDRLGPLRLYVVAAGFLGFLLTSCAGSASRPSSEIPLAIYADAERFVSAAALEVTMSLENSCIYATFDDGTRFIPAFVGGSPEMTADGVGFNGIVYRYGELITIGGPVDVFSPFDRSDKLLTLPSACEESVEVRLVTPPIEVQATG